MNQTTQEERLPVHDCSEIRASISRQMAALRNLDSKRGIFDKVNSCKYLQQCFQHYLVRGTLARFSVYFGGTSKWLNKSKEQGIVAIGGTPGMASTHGTLVCRGIPVEKH